MLNSEFNNKILRLAPKFTAMDAAPHSFETLKANATSGLVIWAGASENTIYGDASINHAFRAWHDSLHLKLNAPFTFEGEKRIALEQARLIGSDTLGLIIIGEVVGQTEYLNKYGHFPIDQLAFMRNYLKGVI